MHRASLALVERGTLVRSVIVTNDAGAWRVFSFELVGGALIGTHKHVGESQLHGIARNLECLEREWRGSGQVTKLHGKPGITAN